ncbi:hypothetical protein [Limnoglobus roseus]|uniref:Uncharacterized protein n=1 Tax=Limnoglobus roseus TaxID=2598579 RepID=A0A5C1A8E2_9BACT|nr:hypothetical protein [Limnoglobus roseus]QEL14276.1 hypothetical protein PX52LOC_01147 [Limnoglobus roseus]
MADLFFDAVGEVRLAIDGNRFTVDVDLPDDDTAPEVLSRFAVSCWLQGLPVEYPVPEERRMRDRYAAAMADAGFVPNYAKTTRDYAAWEPEYDGEASPAAKRRALRNRPEGVRRPLLVRGSR